MFQVFGEEPDFAEELLSGVGGIGGFANPGITKKLKSTGDSSSTSPERRKDDAWADVEKRHHSSEFHHEPSCGPTPTAGYGSRKAALMAMTATTLTIATGKKSIVTPNVATKKKKPNQSSPMLKYLKIRVRWTVLSIKMCSFR